MDADVDRTGCQVPGTVDFGLHNGLLAIKRLQQDGVLEIEGIQLGIWLIYNGARG